MTPLAATPAPARARKRREAPLTGSKFAPAVEARQPFCGGQAAGLMLFVTVTPATMT